MYTNKKENTNKKLYVHNINKRYLFYQKECGFLFDDPM